MDVQSGGRSAGSTGAQRTDVGIANRPFDSLRMMSSSIDPPSLPEEVVFNTRRKYVEAYEQLTGLEFS